MMELDLHDLAIPGAAGSVFALWRIWRKFKEAQREDRYGEVMDQTHLDLIAHLKEEIDRLTTEVKAIAAAQKISAQEKADADMAAAKAQAQALVLQAKVDGLENDVSSLKIEVDKLEKERDEAWEAVKDPAFLARMREEGMEVGKRLARRATDKVTIPIDDKDRRELK